jgi:hypothetical protein
VPAWRLPRTYFAFAFLTLFGVLPAMLVDHDSIRPSTAGLVFIALLLLAVARGHLFAWSLLLLWNGFFVLSVVAVALSDAAGSGGGAASPGDPLLLLNFAVCLALQLAPSMRTHVGLNRKRAPAAL